MLSLQADEAVDRCNGKSSDEVYGLAFAFAYQVPWRVGNSLFAHYKQIHDATAEDAAMAWDEIATGTKISDQRLGMAQLQQQAVNQGLNIGTNMMMPGGSSLARASTPAQMAIADGSVSDSGGAASPSFSCSSGKAGILEPGTQLVPAAHVLDQLLGTFFVSEK